MSRLSPFQEAQFDSSATLSPSKLNPAVVDLYVNYVDPETGHQLD